MLIVIATALIGAVLAMVAQRYVIIVGTAFFGAYTMLIGVAHAMSARGITRGTSGNEVWIFYPTATPDERWIPVATLVLGLIGVAVQLGMTGGKKK